MDKRQAGPGDVEYDYYLTFQSVQKAKVGGPLFERHPCAHKECCRRYVLLLLGGTTPGGPGRRIRSQESSFRTSCQHECHEDSPLFSIRVLNLAPRSFRTMLNSTHFAAWWEPSRSRVEVERKLGCAGPAQSRGLRSEGQDHVKRLWLSDLR